VVSLTLASTLGGDEPSKDQETVLQALRWFNVWVSPLPLDAAPAIRCKGKRAPDYEFVYCEPGHVTVVRLPAGGSGMATRVSTTLTYEDEVRNRKFNGLGDWPKSTRTLSFTLKPEELLGERVRNAQLTKLFYERTRRTMLRPGPLSGANVYFPWVSRGDPDYHVYVVRRGRVVAICEFGVVGSSVTDYVNFTYNRPLVVAQRNLSDQKLWYRIEKFATGGPGRQGH
jgi:hypothetical protein